jgi:pyruvate,water dikinase
MTDTDQQSTSQQRTSAVTWKAPDKGLWSCETAHGAGIPTVPVQELMERGFAAGFRTSLAQLGVPLSHVEIRFVNGWPYVSFFLHDVPRRPGKPPPAFVLKAITRLHPGFRKRTKIAAAAIAEGRPLQFAADWEAERATWIARNLELQHVDTDRLADDDLARHLTRLYGIAAKALERHFALVPGCIPLGAWLAGAAAWGLPRDTARQAVMHSTPVHVEAAGRLWRIADALGDARPTSLDEVRTHSAEAATALDDYIDHHGWWTTSDALNATRVIDHPTIVLAAIRAHRTGVSTNAESDPADLLAELRQLVPVADRAEFDRLAADAHRAHKMLDDNSGILGSWSTGITGEAFRAAGRRLVERGKIRNADDVWALTSDQVIALLDGRSQLRTADVESAVNTWTAQARLTPPAHLNGEPSPPPDPSVFPAPVAQLMTGLGAFLDDKFNDAHVTSGIGTRTVEGRAVVALSPSDAFDRLEPGDILVTTATTPAYNSVLPIVGGLVVSTGGPSCHAAIVARELDLPAIVGLSDALTSIPDGAMISLDPVNARVTLLEHR